jgi:hypothetical protein
MSAVEQMEERRSAERDAFVVRATGIAQPGAT